MGYVQKVELERRPGPEGIEAYSEGFNFIL